MPEYPEWWMVADIAKHYRVSTDYVYKAIRLGKLIANRMGDYRIHNAERLAWEERTRVQEDKNVKPRPRRRKFDGMGVL